MVEILIKNLWLINKLKKFWENYGDLKRENRFLYYFLTKKLKLFIKPNDQ